MKRVFYALVLSVLMTITACNINYEDNTETPVETTTEVLTVGIDINTVLNTLVEESTQRRTLYVYYDNDSECSFNEWEPEPEVSTDEEITECSDCEGCAWMIDLLAYLIMAEARDQDEYGQRLVIDVVLNRVFDEHFPNDIEGVIYQPEQFTCTVDGNLFKTEPTERVYELIYEELENRTNTEVLYFRTQHFHTFGTPLFQYGAHYFSKR